jgi:dTDP-4-amino-4,6-dideoxygalactose transaminase
VNLRIPFNRPLLAAEAFRYMQEAADGAHLSGNGPFARRCTAWLEERAGTSRALLTHSGTGALEMAALLAGIGPGDEVIMPSFTFASTANAFVLRGATPVFVDIRADTLNLDERAVPDAIGPRTRAIVPVHYAGVGCEMDDLLGLAREHGLTVIEDAAQALLATYRGRALGTLGQFGAISFHESKNIHAGEGGALLVGRESDVERAEVVHEKGTDRARFSRGEVDKYTWVDVGSSFPPSELQAAFLWSQLERADRIVEERLRLWDRYHAGLADLENTGKLRRPVIPADRRHNGHLYYVLVGSMPRDRFIAALAEVGIRAVFHYVPLHSSPAGRRYGRAPRPLPATDDASARLVRLPIWSGMSMDQIDEVTATIHRVLA